MTACKHKVKELIDRIEYARPWYLSWFLLAILIALFVVGKLLIAGRWFTNITVIDESLYINAARSLHNEGKLLYQSQPSVLQHILYPAVLSLAYFFYSPVYMMIIMRLLGTVVYASGFILVFLLSRKILNSSVKALGVVIIVMCIPETNYALFMSQEILQFPLMMSAFYLMYMTACNCENGIAKGKQALYQILLGIVLCLISENKTVGIIIFLAYIVYVLLIEYCVLGRFKHTLGTFIKLVYTVAAYILLSILMSIVKTALFERTGIPVVDDSSLYSPSITYFIGQLTNNFGSFMLEFITGSFYYFFYFCIASLFLPVILPLLGYRELDEAERRLLLSTICVTVFMIAIIIIEIYPLEGGSALYPQRVHLRFLYYMFIPLIILSAKLVGKKLRINPAACAVTLFILVYAIIRHNQLGIDLLSGSIYDSMSLYMFNALTRFPAMTILIPAVFAIVILAGMIYIKRKKSLPAPVFIAASVLAVFCFVGNTYQHVRTVYSQSYDSRDFSAVAKVLEDEDNVLLIPAYEDDIKFFWLDAYLNSDNDCINLDELLRGAIPNETDHGLIGSIELSNIVPRPWGYKRSAFPLGEIDYIVVRKGVVVLNAQHITENNSALFDVYKINNGVVEFPLG